MALLLIQGCQCLIRSVPPHPIKLLLAIFGISTWRHGPPLTICCKEPQPHRRLLKLGCLYLCVCVCVCASVCVDVCVSMCLAWVVVTLHRCVVHDLQHKWKPYSNHCEKSPSQRKKKALTIESKLVGTMGASPADLIASLRLFWLHGALAVFNNRLAYLVTHIWVSKIKCKIMIQRGGCLVYYHGPTKPHFTGGVMWERNKGRFGNSPETGVPASHH